MQALLIWSIILLPSVAWGLFCAYKIKSKHAKFIAGAVPWITLLIALLFSVYYLPYEEVDASMWPIAQLFAGTIMAVVGVFSYNYGCKLFKSS